MASADERQQAARLLKIHKRNLQRLEVQKAEQAGALNIALDNQIDQERANIAALEPIANPPPLPSAKVQEFVKATTPQDIDNMMLFMQGVQLNARMTKAEEHDARQDERMEQIIQEQQRASVWRLTMTETVEASERARAAGAPWYRRVLTFGLAFSLLALLVSCAALAAVWR